MLCYHRSFLLYGSLTISSILRDYIYILSYKLTKCKCLHSKENKQIFKEDNMFYNYQIHICFQ